MAKWVLVTGAAKGLGREIVLELARRKEAAVIHYQRSEKEARALQNACHEMGSDAEIIQGDFGASETIHDFIDRYKSQFIDTKALINNVGNYLVAPLSQTSEKEWLALFQTNVHAPFLLCKALIPLIKLVKGKIINIGNIGLHAPRATVYCPAYTFTKSVLWQLTLSLAKEYAPDQVSINMVSPGYLETSIDVKDFTFPMGRPTTLQEVARVVGLFFEKATDHITGENLEVAGGFGL